MPQCTADVAVGSFASLTLQAKIEIWSLLPESGHFGDLPQYLLMNLSRRNAIAGLNLSTPKFAGLRGATLRYE
jgi:hypothetical protein